jgi:hypothetical protein
LSDLHAVRHKPTLLTGHLTASASTVTSQPVAADTRRGPLLSITAFFHLRKIPV